MPPKRTMSVSLDHLSSVTKLRTFSETAKEKTQKLWGLLFIPVIRNYFY